MRNPIVIVIILITSLVLISNCNSKEQQTSDNKFSSHIKSLPNGSADVSCTIIEFEKKHNVDYCLVNIDTVFGYGPSTPPISQASKLKLTLTSSQVVKLNESLQMDKVNHNFEISEPRTGMGVEKSDIWYLNKIKN